MPIIVKPSKLISTALTLSMFGRHPRFAKRVAHYGIQCKTNIDEQKWCGGSHPLYARSR